MMNRERSGGKKVTTLKKSDGNEPIGLRRDGRREKLEQKHRVCLNG